MNQYIIFDKTGHIPDRYTIISRSTGNVFAAGEHTEAIRLCGNCAAHRITLFGAGWRQMPLQKRIIEAETDNYVGNARLNPAWLGQELEQRDWPKYLNDAIAQMEKNLREEQPIRETPYIISPKAGVPSQTAMAS